MLQAMASKKPTDAPKGFSEWGDRLYRLRFELGLTQEALADLCGVKRLRILQLEGKTVKIPQSAVAMLAKALKVERGAVDSYLTGGMSLSHFILMHRGKPLPKADTHRAFLQRLSDRVGLPFEEVVTLTAEGASGMDELSVTARRGVMGVVYMLGYPIETAMAAAREVLRERGELGEDAEEWVAAIRKKLPPKPPSGSFPLSSQIKIPTKKRR